MSSEPPCKRFGINDGDKYSEYSLFRYSGFLNGDKVFRECVHESNCRAFWRNKKKMTYSYIVGTIGTIKKDNVFYIIRHVEIYVTHKNIHVKMRVIYIQFLFEIFSREKQFTSNLASRYETLSVYYTQTLGMNWNFIKRKKTRSKFCLANKPLERFSLINILSCFRKKYF